MEDKRREELEGRKNKLHIGLLLLQFIAYGENKESKFAEGNEPNVILQNPHAMRHKPKATD